MLPFIPILLNSMKCIYKLIRIWYWGIQWKGACLWCFSWGRIKYMYDVNTTKTEASTGFILQWDTIWWSFSISFKSLCEKELRNIFIMVCYYLSFLQFALNIQTLPLQIYDSYDLFQDLVLKLIIWSPSLLTSSRL